MATVKATPPSKSKLKYPISTRLQKAKSTQRKQTVIKKSAKESHIIKKEDELVPISKRTKAEIAMHPALMQRKMLFLLLLLKRLDNFAILKNPSNYFLF
jgi:hypothetical protein